MTDAATVTRSRTYGIVSIDEARLALPLSALREVVPFPAAAHRLPAAAPGLLGAMNLRGAVVPMLDLRCWMDGDDTPPPAIVVLVADEGRLLGLAADGIEGITTIDDDDRQAITAAGDAMLLSHAFQHPSTGDVISVLDVDAVLSLPGVPVADDVTTAAATSTVDGGERRQLTVVRAGEHAVAIDVERVFTTLPPGPLLASVLTGGDCIGVIHHGDCEVPVLDPVSLLGLGATDPERHGPRAVLRLPQGEVVLQLDDVVRILELTTDEILALPPTVLRRPDLFEGMAVVEGIGQVFVVDGAALVAEQPVQTLAGLNTLVDLGATTGPGTSVAAVGAAPGTARAADGAPAAEADAARTDREYLLLRAGIELAVPLEQVDEIVPWPTDLIDTLVGGAVHGVVVHRDTSVPVLCVAMLLGRPRPVRTPRTCVLMVDVDGVRTGLVVECLERIDRLSWAERPSDELADDARTGEARRGLLRLGSDTELVPAVDLRALARQLTTV